MVRQRLTLPRRVVLLTLLTFCGSGFQAAAQDTADLPPGAAGLPPGELVDLIRQMKSEGSLTSDSSRAAKEHLRSVILDTDFLDTADYIAINKVHQTARLHQIDRAAPEAQAVRRATESILARNDNWQGRTWAELWAKVQVMQRCGISLEARASEAQRWLEAGGSLADIPAEDFGDARRLFSTFHLSDGRFSVKWEGRITAPRSGMYTFLVSPFDVNGSNGTYHVQKTMTVAVDGSEVLSATPQNWDRASKPVQLEAGQAVALQVELTMESSRRQGGIPHALLYWTGPDLEESIVPADRLTTPNGSAPGLQATYQWTVDGERQTLQRIDRAIDFAWYSGRVTPVSNAALEQQKTDELWQTAMAPAYLDSMEQTKSKDRHVFLFDIEFNRVASAECLNSSQRQAFLKMLWERPRLCERLTALHVMRAYRSFRFGAEEDALRVFQQWAIANADLKCGRPKDPDNHRFDEANRQAYFEMAKYVTHQLPEHGRRLEQESLEQADGRCCLPVAFILGYSYVSQDRLGEWIAKLDEKLAEDAVTGDVRVNWLLARAHAAELLSTRPEPYAAAAEQCLRGRRWLDEAVNEAAQSPAVKARVTRDLALRLACYGQFDQARDLLNRTPESDGFIGSALKQIDAYQSAQDVRRQQAEDSVQQAYLDRLSRRRERASARGDTAAVNRYDALISAATDE